MRTSINKDIIDFFVHNKKIIFNKDEETYLKKNNLCDYYLYKRGNKEYLKKKEKQRILLLDKFESIAEKYSIDYFFMKSFLNYPFYDDDVDVVILSDSKILTSELKNNGFTFIQNISNIREPLKKMYSYKNNYFKLHIHKEVSWNGIVVLDKNEVFRRTIFKKLNEEYTIKIPCFEDEILIAAAHFLFENYYIKLGEILYLKYLLDQGIDWNDVNNSAEKYGWKKGLDYFLGLMKNMLITFGIDQEIINISSIKGENMLKCYFPCYVKYKDLLPIYKYKMKTDLSKKPISIPRQLFTYGILYIWKYKLPKKGQQIV